MKNKPNESSDQTNSENEPSEEFKRFEEFSKKIGSITRQELDSILEKEKRIKDKQKTRNK